MVVLELCGGRNECRHDHSVPYLISLIIGSLTCKCVPPPISKCAVSFMLTLSYS
jgi:hypothetical protein